MQCAQVVYIQTTLPTVPAAAGVAGGAVAGGAVAVAVTGWFPRSAIVVGAGAASANVLGPIAHRRRAGRPAETSTTAAGTDAGAGHTGRVTDGRASQNGSLIEHLTATVNLGAIRRCCRPRRHCRMSRAGGSCRERGKHRFRLPRLERAAATAAVVAPLRTLCAARAS